MALPKALSTILDPIQSLLPRSWRIEVNEQVERVWLWVRIPTVITGAVGATFLFPGAEQLPALYAVTAAVPLYSVALWWLLRNGHVRAAVATGITADSWGLMLAWWIILQIPTVATRPTDLYLILLPVIIAGIIRLGPAFGFINGLGWIAWLGAVAWVAHGPDSYAAEQFPVRAIFLLITAGLTSMLVSKVAAQQVSLNDALETLALSERRFRTVFESAPAGIALTDLDRRVFVSNETLSQMLGLSRSELQGHRVSEFEIDREDRLGEGSFQDLLDGTIEQVAMTQSLSRPDGQTIDLYSSTTLVPDDDGSPLFAIRVFEDVTERRQFEKAKDELLALTAHEVKTPLTAMHAALGLLSETFFDRLDDDLKSIVALAMRTSHRLVALIQDTLDLEALALGHLQMHYSTHDAAVLVPEIVSIHQPNADQLGIGLVTEVEPIQFECSKEKLAQVLTNLVSNALKFSPEGTHVTVRAYEDGDEIVFEVQDQGPGIPLDQQGQVFERFRRLQTADPVDAGGTGLGLAVAQAIVTAHGGTIGIESVEGEGSTFTVRLPLHQDMAAIA